MIGICQGHGQGHLGKIKTIEVMTGIGRIEVKMAGKMSGENGMGIAGAATGIEEGDEATGRTEEAGMGEGVGIGMKDMMPESIKIALVMVGGLMPDNTGKRAQMK